MKSVASLVLLMMLAFSAQAESTKAVSVPAGDLMVALESLTKQLGIELIYHSDQLKGQKTKGVKGTLSAKEAVRKVLEGTRFVLQTDSSGAMVVSPATSGADSGHPADQMRVAMVGSETDSKSTAETSEEKENQVIVEGERGKRKPFSDSNLDIPRGVDDIQAYYIFDNEMLRRSGALNVEDFLKQNLTMSTTALSNRQKNMRTPNSRAVATGGNVSSIDLRGLGAEKTLILLNGRRLPALYDSSNDLQADINGIPMGSIARIEVLPASASGIYGASALGGVVNIILRDDYAGGQVSALYDNSFDTDSARRTVSASYGMSLEGGRTDVSLFTQWTDSATMILRDRLRVYDQRRNAVMLNDPSYFSNPLNYFRSAPMGRLMNINNTQYNATRTALLPLELKSGGVIPSGFTHLSAGLGSDTPRDVLYADLLANGGTYNLEIPESNNFLGLGQPFGAAIETYSVQLAFNRKMTSNIDMSIGVTSYVNNSQGVYNPMSGTTMRVAANAPNNPFTTEVAVAVPTSFAVPNVAKSRVQTLSVALKAQLPFGWQSLFDAAFTQNSYGYNYFYEQHDPVQNDYVFTGLVRSGQIDVFVDPRQLNPDLSALIAPMTYDRATKLRGFQLRGSGPLLRLPWGEPQLTVGLEQRTEKVPGGTQENNGSDGRSLTEYFPRSSESFSLYAETEWPLVPVRRFPLLHSLSLQLSGRVERFTVDAGTIGTTLNTSQPLGPNNPRYVGLTRDGDPYFATERYRTRNETIGFKYQPIPQLTVRASLGTAFVPPSPYSLIPNPFDDEWPSEVTDLDGSIHSEVTTRSGGNPNLKPENSRNHNLGVIWQPQGALEGLRANVEYTKTEQFDAVAYLSAQAIVDRQSMFSDRIIRDDTGRITFVDTTNVNLFGRFAESMDYSLDYERLTRFGRFALRAQQTVMQKLETQYSIDSPSYDAAGYSPGEGGGPRYKRAASFSLEKGPLVAGWSTQYFGSYGQYCAPGGPRSVRGQCRRDRTLSLQGSNSVASQMYHDLFIAYSFRRDGLSGGFLSGLVSGGRINIGVRNVFNSAAPLDAHYIYNYFMSPYGDSRLRTYWLSVSKDL